MGAVRLSEVELEHLFAFGIKHYQAFLQLEDENGFGSREFVQSNALEANAETGLDDPGRILANGAVIQEEIRPPLEEVNFVGPPGESYEFFRLIFLNFQDLGSVIYVKLIQLKKNFLRRFETLSRRVLHLYGREVDLASCDGC